ncbi:signal peptide peptidase SppA [Niveispirillum fermenti]|uniref:signal peptide peptidase SppA n=1 Tax=Niveispirillum fermenti TaxID=1233113 RepID=UPI003A83D54A
MRIILRVFAIIGFLSVVLVAGLIALGIHFANRKPTLPDNIVLELDLEQPLVEAAATDPVAGLLMGQNTRTVQEVVRALGRAAADPRVKGIVARTGDSVHSLAVTQELRESIIALRKEGRFAIVHAESFGETGNGMQPYLLATAFDQVWMQPLGDLAITGIRAELAFLRGTLDKLKVEPQFRKREEYKTFAEQYTETGPTPANREATEALVGDIFDQWVASVAQGRGLDEAVVRAAVDRAPLMDGEAVDAKLIDKLGYWDEAVEWALGRAALAGGPAELVSLHDYFLAAAGDATDLGGTQAPLIAIIVGEGAIMRGDSRSDPLSGEETFGAATIAAAFDEAIGNDQVKAILFRVDSPGGSAVASEVVRRKVVKAREVGKPVIISMGAVAASGGYWVSMGADRIVAQPGTITGSIGVLAGKLVTRGLTDWAGVNFEPVSRGANAGMWSSNEPFTPAQEERLGAFLDNTYQAFVRGVAEGRGMAPERVAELAKGRVYTGRQALELGLVDALGGYTTALAELRTALKLEPGTPLSAISLPHKRSQFDLLMDMLSGNSRVALGDALTAHVAGRSLGPLRPVMSELAPHLSADQDMVALMPAMVRQGF